MCMVLVRKLGVKCIQDLRRTPFPTTPSSALQYVSRQERAVRAWILFDTKEEYFEDHTNGTAFCNRQPSVYLPKSTMLSLCPSTRS